MIAIFSILFNEVQSEKKKLKYLTPCHVRKISVYFATSHPGFSSSEEDFWDNVETTLLLINDTRTGGSSTRFHCACEMAGVFWFWW